MELADAVVAALLEVDQLQFPVFTIHRTAGPLLLLLLLVMVLELADLCY